MSWPKRLKKQLSAFSMPALSNSSPRPSAVNSRMPCGSSVRPTPSSFISGARSKTRQGMPRLCRLSARVSPQIPAPIMRISSIGMASVTDHGSAERALFEMPLRGRELAEDEHGTGSDQHGNSTGEENRRNMPFRAQHHPPEDRTYDRADTADAKCPADAG